MPPNTPALEYIIAPNRSWLRFDGREFAEHRDLLWLLVRRDLVTKYKQTILGPLWHVVQPLVTALVFTIVFSQVAAISTDGAPRVLFYLSSLLGWNYFSQCLSATSGVFTANAGLFGKVYFPRLVVPLSTVLSNLVSTGVQLGVFVIFYAAYKWFTPGQGISMGWHTLLLPLFMLQTAVLSLGLGLALSSLTAKYRDLQHAVPFVISVWMFASPVFYPVSQVASEWRGLFLLNPLAPILESIRYSLLGTGKFHPGALALSALVTVLTLTAGLMLFQRTERTALDTV